ncbi:MAG: CBS domain-containing protein [Candidatus Helarchaeota archaeon]
MKIEYLSDEYTTVKPEDSALKVTKKLTEPNILTAIVVDKDEKVLGAIIKNTLLKTCIIEGKDPNSVTARDLMGPIETIREGTEFLDAIKLMAEKSVKAIAILKEGKLHGVLSMYDAISLLYKMQTHEPTIVLPNEK